MKQLERIEKNLQELANNGAKIYMFKSKKYWILTYKDNENAKAEYSFGLNDIESFTTDKLCELDSRTGITY